MSDDLTQPADPDRARRLELILRELEMLPTLGSVAIRLLELTADPESEARAVVELVASDPALAARVLGLCRCHERGRASKVATVERAVLLLGFDAVRTAVLAVQVFDVLDHLETPAGERPASRPTFDREAFWLHSLAVAVVAESIAQKGISTRELGRGEAFMAGLLHDIGQLVLHVLLPESFDRVCRVTETHSASLDRACRQIIGIDPHTAGKRLAEQWGLPEALVDVVWLNGQPYEALPATSHRNLVALVTLADAVVRSRYIVPSAHWARAEELDALLLPLGITPDAVDAAVSDLHDQVAGRAHALGLDVAHDPTILLRAITRANRSLARMNSGMRQRERLAREQARVLDAIRRFHEAHEPGAPAGDVLEAIAHAVAESLGARVGAALHKALGGGWRLLTFDDAGRPLDTRAVEAPPDAIPLDAVLDDVPRRARARTILPWIADRLGLEPERFDEIELLPLPAPRGGAVLLVEPGPRSGDLEAIEGLAPAWRAALVAGAQRDAASELTEQLAIANRELLGVQARLARNQTMATLGEVAAGAAHEMNNPLTVISGRGQFLSMKIKDPQLHAAAHEITEQAARLSDMITALRSFAEPCEPKRRVIDVADLVVRAVQQHGPGENRQPRIHTVFTESIPAARIDPELLGSALGELVRNACESKGSRHVELRVQTEPLEGRLKIEVRDDGAGLSDHALRHAFDPFYSEKPAGRQPGLGLARASRYVEAHGGTVTLANGPGGGAVATIWLRDWRAAPAVADAA